MAYWLLRSLGEFEPTTELFSSYLERLDQFFIANDIGQCAADATDAVQQAAEKKKVAVLISVMGKRSYNTLCDLCMPDSPKDKKFKELCDLLKFHYKPKSLEVAGTIKFHQCKQQENESISDYSARLRHLAADCNFGAFLERSLRDQFVSRIYNSSARKKLLNEDRSFQDALKVPVAEEAARKETMFFEERKGPTVNVVRNQFPPSPSRGEPLHYGYNTTVHKPLQRNNQTMLREYPYKSYPSPIPSSCLL